ncbi:hypothetical protein M1525_00960 [Patescibacteria group bacterium]|nr:hypothetical protein [Patescibacteria group bacterium]
MKQKVLKIIKSKNFLISLGLSFFLFLLINIIVAAPKKKTISFLQAQATNQNQLDQFESTLKKYSPQTYSYLETQSEQILKTDLQGNLTDLNTKANEIDNSLIAFASPITNKVKADPSKQAGFYADEFAQVNSNLTKIKIDLNNNQSLQTNSSIYLETAKAFGRIQPPPNFYKFQIFWIFNLTSRAYIFNQLSQNPDSQKKLILLSILNNLNQSQDKVLTMLNQ